MSERLVISPDRYGDGEPTVWTASWGGYDASGLTIELALAGLIEALGAALLKASNQDRDPAIEPEGT